MVTTRTLPRCTCLRFASAHVRAQASLPVLAVLHAGRQVAMAAVCVHSFGGAACSSWHRWVLNWLALMGSQCASELRTRYLYRNAVARVVQSKEEEFAGAEPVASSSSGATCVVEYNRAASGPCAQAKDNSAGSSTGGAKADRATSTQSTCTDPRSSGSGSMLTTFSCTQTDSARVSSECTVLAQAHTRPVGLPETPPRTADVQQRKPAGKDDSPRHAEAVSGVRRGRRADAELAVAVARQSAHATMYSYPTKNHKSRCKVRES